MSMHSRIFARRVHHTYPHRTQWTYSCTSYMRTIQHCDRALGTNNTDDDNGNGQATTATDDDNGNGHAQAGQHARFMRRWSRGFFFFFPGFSRLSILRCLLHLALVLSKTMKISSSEDEAACQTHEECSQMREERAVQVLCDARAGMLRGAWRGRAHAWRGAMRMVRRRCGRGRDARRCRAHRARPPERAARARETNGCWAASHLCAALRLAGHLTESPQMICESVAPGPGAGNNVRSESLL
jgi:hypothetical protein